MKIPRLTTKIGILIVIEIILITASFSFLASVEGQNILIGNSINIAGKNRFLSEASLLETERYMVGNADRHDVDAALAELEANILALRDGGEIDGIQLSPTRQEFVGEWQQVYDDWLAYKTLASSIASAPPEAGHEMSDLEATNAKMVASSDALVRELGEFSHRESQNLVSLQVGLGALNIGVHLFMLYLIVRTLKPIRSLRDATARISEGHLDFEIAPSGDDELRELAESFDSMVESLRESTRQLEESRKKYHEMYDKSPNPYRSIDANGTIVDCNEAYVRSLGYERKEEVVGHSIFEHTAERSLDEMQRSFEEWRSTGTIVNKQLRMKRRDGSAFPVSLSANSIYDEQTGRLAGSNTVIVDESEQYRARQMLEQANEELRNIDKIKDEFINIAAHELRTPVVPIILNAEELAGEMTDDVRVNAILRNAKRITRLANNILDASRIESNTFKIVRFRANIADMLQDAIEDARARVQEGKRLKIVLENRLKSETDENILIDPGRIEQVLTNLLENAINFTESGQITVTLEKKEQSLHVSVADTGNGIDATVKDRLFQKFVTKTNNARGTGLGLYLSKAIVKAHGGRIWAENSKIGRGAMFSFSLPAG